MQSLYLLLPDFSLITMGALSGAMVPFASLLATGALSFWLQLLLAV